MTNKKIEEMLKAAEDGEDGWHEILRLDQDLNEGERAEVVEAAFKKYPEDEKKRKGILEALFDVCYVNSMCDGEDGSVRPCLVYFGPGDLRVHLLRRRTMGQNTIRVKEEIF